jgi:hypothetical protein
VEAGLGPCREVEFVANHPNARLKPPGIVDRHDEPAFEPEIGKESHHLPNAALAAFTGRQIPFKRPVRAKRTPNVGIESDVAPAGVDGSELGRALGGKDEIVEGLVRWRPQPTDKQSLETEPGNRSAHCLDHRVRIRLAIQVFDELEGFPPKSLGRFGHWRPPPRSRCIAALSR